MGRDDVIKQSTNVLKAKLFGAKVVECFDGTGEKGVLKDACTAVLKAWSSDPDAFYCCGSAIGPHPFPRIVQYAQSVIGKEIREPLMHCFRDYLNKYPLLRKSNYINSLTLLQRTEPTGGYHDFHTENLGWNNSSRSMAWMIYLNNVEEGGETEFLYIGKRIQARAGRLIIFPAGFTHAHRGNPPLGQTKYICSSWGIVQE